MHFKYNSGSANGEGLINVAGVTNVTDIAVVIEDSIDWTDLIDEPVFSEVPDKDRLSETVSPHS